MARSWSEVLDAVWLRVDRNGPVPTHVPDLGPCWVWTGAGCRYGTMKIGRTSVNTHRLAWESANGPVPAGLHVLHRCDNGKCCRPSHLWLGTHAENMADKAAKGRSVARQPGPEFVRFGERNIHAKLTADKVIEMRRLHAGGASFYSLARQFGVAEHTARDAIAGRTWRHVGAPSSGRAA